MTTTQKCTTTTLPQVDELDVSIEFAKIFSKDELTSEDVKTIIERSPELLAKLQRNAYFVGLISLAENIEIVDDRFIKLTKVDGDTVLYDAFYSDIV